MHHWMTNRSTVLQQRWGTSWACSVQPFKSTSIFREMLLACCHFWSRDPAWIAGNSANYNIFSDFRWVAVIRCQNEPSFGTGRDCAKSNSMGIIKSSKSTVANDRIEKLFLPTVLVYNIGTPECLLLAICVLRGSSRGTKREGKSGLNSCHSYFQLHFRGRFSSDYKANEQ
jgi:hypothetical protein